MHNSTTSLKPVGFVRAGDPISQTTPVPGSGRPSNPRPRRPIQLRDEEPGVGSDVGLVLFGILLPAATVVIELMTRMCTTSLFDPMPTPWHVAVVSMVPIGNLLVWLATRSGRTRYLTVLGVLNGVSIGVAACYALVF